MSKQDFESPKKLQFQQIAKSSKRLPYRQPAVYSIGSLEQVQALYTGRNFDGPDRAYYYEG